MVIGAVFTQLQDDNWRVVSDAYASRNLTDVKYAVMMSRWYGLMRDSSCMFLAENSIWKLTINLYSTSATSLLNLPHE